MKALPRFLYIAALLFGAAVRADDLNDRLNERLEYWTLFAEKWASDPMIVSAVEAQNKAPSDAVKAMTQEAWAAATDKDPFVFGLTRNDAAKFMKEKRPESITEAFVSDAEGRKVAYLGKTTNWSHKGRPKHDQPMQGKRWRGSLELDKSTGMKQIQISVPVLKDGQPIGSLVLGVSLSDITTK